MSGLDLTLREKSRDEFRSRDGTSPSSEFSTPELSRKMPLAMPPRYWEGVKARAMSSEVGKTFWQRVDAWVSEASAVPEPAAMDFPPNQDYVFFADHTFPCLQRQGEALVVLCRSTAGSQSGSRLSVSVTVEANEGGAKAGRDFEAKTHEVVFKEGAMYALIRIPVKYHKDVWQNSSWFNVRVSGVVTGTADIAAPASAVVLVLDEDVWPANIPAQLRGGEGISLLRYFVREGRLRRGEKWRKTMIAMVWMPVHSVFVTTMVQKVLVDHAVLSIKDAAGRQDVTWFYWECAVLVLVQLVSLGLCRWADVVQTRNRGRTGGFRQFYRGEIIRKYMHLEHAEHWDAAATNWLYSLFYDADVVTGQAYFQVFVMCQSIFALVLSTMLIVSLALWGYATAQTTSKPGRSPLSLQNMYYMTGTLVMIPVGLVGVWLRRRLFWIAIIARKTRESHWFRSTTWIIGNWRHFYGMTWQERAMIEKTITKQNTFFLPAHWDARDTMNDTSWMTHWVQGIFYCMMLLVGIYELIEYEVYGIGAMQVGTFYALCKIYMTVGKYVGKLGGVFVSMQKAVVSLREISALLNLCDQRSQRREALRLIEFARNLENDGPSKIGSNGAVAYLGGALSWVATEIEFKEGTLFIRPSRRKIGPHFGELEFAVAFSVPLGRTIMVAAQCERMLNTFLGLCSRVLHPTDAEGEAVAEPGVVVPRGLRLLMLPTVPMVTCLPSQDPVSVTDHLAAHGMAHDLCTAFVTCLGLDPYANVKTLDLGSQQVFAIAKVMLFDPDVICSSRPLALVPGGMRPRIAELFRLWQSKGGMRAIADFLGVPQTPTVFRQSRRTLVVGHMSDEPLGFSRWPCDVQLNLDDVLSEGETLDNIQAI